MSNSNSHDHSRLIISLIKLKPSLWNPKDSKYSNRPFNDKLWLELSNKMQVSCTDLKAKWTSLRNSYRRSIRSDNIDPNKPRSKWYLQDEMDFLKGLGQSRKRSSKTKTLDNPKNIIKDNIEIINDPIIDYPIINYPTNSIAPRSPTSTRSSIYFNDNEIQFRNKNNVEVEIITKQEEEFNQELITIEEDKIHDELITQQLSKVNGEINFNDNLITKQSEEKFICTKPLKRCADETLLTNEIDEKRIKILQLQLQQQPNSDSLFFESIEFDFIKLPIKQKRKFKTDVMNLMNELLDETDEGNGN